MSDGNVSALCSQMFYCGSELIQLRILTMGTKQYSQIKYIIPI